MEADEDASVRRTIDSVGAADVPRLVDESAFRSRWKGTPESLARAIASGAVFVVTRDGRRLVPSFFVDGALAYRRLSAVAKLLFPVGNHAKWLFFVTPKASLGGLTPLDALRKGMLQQVKVAARGFAER